MSTAGRRAEAKQIAVLHDRLFKIIERSQGQAFVSDGPSGAKTVDQWFRWLEDRIDWNAKATRAMRAFLKRERARAAAKTGSA